MKLEKFTVHELKNPTKETRDKLNVIVEELNKLHKENFKNSINNWNKLNEKVPPVNVEVDLKYINKGEEMVHEDMLIPMLDGTYIWSYGDYTGCEVIEWKLR